MSGFTRLPRRTMLKGLGAAVAVPWLEAMGPLTGWASGAGPARTAPNRMAVLYVPNGKNMADWTPQEKGSQFELPAILEPLADVRDQVLVLTGLTADKARGHGDGPGDHARALAAFLTGAHPKKTDGTDIRNGVSADQVAAARIGHLTRLPSLEMGAEAGAMAGNCDSGYSCVYSSTMSWRSATQPLPKLVDPKLVFERLFGTGDTAAQKRRDAARRSVLDFVKDEAKQLDGKLGAGDKRKLDEYLTSIRDVEQRIERAGTLPPPEIPKGAAAPQGIPGTYEEHLRSLADLLVLAFQADVTRVATFVLANEGSNKPYKFIGVSEGHHDLSHHGNDAGKKAKIRDINRFHVRQLAYLLGKLKSIREGDGTLLDHCLIAYGSGNSDGNAHNHDNLPVLLCGGGGGTVKSGRHVRLPNETPLANLWRSMLSRMDVQVPYLGDSTGTVGELAG